MTRGIVSTAIVAALLAPAILGANQQNQFAVKLPSSLSITDAEDGHPAKLRHVDSLQTFEAQGQSVTVSTTVRGLTVEMTAGSFTWAQPLYPPYENTFRTLQLKFDTVGHWISFKID